MGCWDGRARSCGTHYTGSPHGHCVAVCANIPSLRHAAGIEWSRGLTSMLRHAVSLFWVALIALGMFGAAGGARAQDERRTVLVATVDGAIFPVVAGYVDRAVQQAEDRNAEALVIRMNTPGGLDTSMRQIIFRILGSKVPVIVYVAPNGARAASAGAYITEAAHVAAMAP